MQNSNIDSIQQQMFSEGVNQDSFRDEIDHYLTCPSCSQSISQTNKPSLLNCGHIICQRCIKKNQKYCVKEINNWDYSGSHANKKPFEIRVRPYKTLLTYIKRLGDGGKYDKYNFSVGKVDQKVAKIFMNQPSSMKWEQLLTKSQAFRQFYDRTQDGTQIIIMSKSELYDQIKETPIYKYAKDKGVTFLKGDNLNEIKFYDRNLGGQ